MGRIGVGRGFGRAGLLWGNWVVSLKKGVSERGGRSIARMVLEVSMAGRAAGSALIITVSGSACLGTRVALSITGAEIVTGSFPTCARGEKGFRASHGKVIIFLGIDLQFSSRRRKGQVY